MSSKIHITIEDGIDAETALLYVSRVISKGRVSGKGKKYCWATIFESGVTVVTNPYTKSDCFSVYMNNEVSKEE